MFVTIITDCRDANASGRQLTRAAAYFSCPATLVGVRNDLEAAGNLTDVLDAAEGKEGVLLVNVAPRNGSGKKWQNGTPFGFFYHEKTLVLASVDGLTLSLVKKLGLVSKLRLLDISTVTAHWRGQGALDDRTKNRIDTTQFRSFEFLPRAAAALHQGAALPTTELSLDSIQDAPHAVWWVDNFGNCKTTLLKEDVDTRSSVQTFSGPLPFFARLKDVPEGQAAFIEGSSGIGEKRFLELAVQGKSAAAEFNLKAGSAIV